MGSIIAALLGVVGGAHGQMTVPGYRFQGSQPTNQQGPYEFVRGVDVWDDGVIWTAAGTGSLNMLENCTNVNISIWDAGARVDEAGLPVCPNPQLLSTDLTSLNAYYNGGVTHLWPTDLACYDPYTYDCNIENISTRAVVVGGWNSLGGDIFVGDDDEQGVMTCLNSSANHAFLYSINVERAVDTVASYCNAVVDTDEMKLSTFVALDNVGSTLQPSVVINSVDAGPDLLITTCPRPEQLDDPLTSTIVAAGSFRGRVQFRGPCALTGGMNGTFVIERTSLAHSEDCFISSHEFQGDLLTQDRVFNFGSSGDDAILGVSQNLTTGEVVVCGYYSGEDMNFAPLESVPQYVPYHGGKDLFVASYTYFRGQNNAGGVWQLNWCKVIGTSGDERATGVWSDSSGRTFYTGWSGPDGTGAGELLVGAIEDGEFLWQRQVTSTEMVRGLDVCVDGIGRPLVSGEFSGYLTFPGSTVDAIAGPNSDIDGFVVRFNPDTGDAQWCLKKGVAGIDESVTDVNVCQFTSARLVFGGDNGIEGFTDAYDHISDGEPDRHIALLFDSTIDQYADGAHQVGGFLGSTDWIETFALIADRIGDPSNDWYDGSVSMQCLLFHGAGMNQVNPHHDLTLNPFGYEFRAGAYQAIPHTVIHSRDEAVWFARRLASLPWWRAGQTTYYAAPAFWQLSPYSPESGLALASDYFNPTALLSYQRYDENITTTNAKYASYRHLVAFFKETPNNLYLGSTSGYYHPDLQTLVTQPAVGGQPRIDQINAVAMHHPLNLTMSYPTAIRADVAASGTDSNVRISPPVDAEKNIAIAAQADGLQTSSGPNPSFLSAWQTTIADNGASSFESILDRMFLRMTVCPGDYNRVSGVQATPTIQTGVDWNDFVNAYGSSALYADWNFDGNIYSNGPIPGQNDYAKFFAGFSAGCP